ncbi:MAG: YbaB/EbfC family nucleoid-associated protein [Clostridia bacterium]|nr:YbaB/EbfC family nucleoid-associated protein [Clostridia bacterium]
MNVRLPKNGAGNMQDMLKQAQKLQEDMANLEKELEGREYEVSAGGGAVTVKINGKKEILSLDIDPDIVDPDDIETMSDIIVAGVNEAIRRVTDTASDEMQKLTGPMGLGMPGMGLPF